MAKISSRTYLKFMRFFRPVEYYLVVVDRLRSYHLVVQVDFCVFFELFRVGLIWSLAMGTPMQSYVDLLSSNGDTNDLSFDDFKVETHVEQVAEHCTPPLKPSKKC